jgi:cysteine desulfurase
LEKSISNRFYFDYNATSPLSIKVQDFLRSGDFLFANPSSIHQDGKSSKKRINETSNYLFDLFQLSEKEFNLIYHSGASEGINSFFKGLAISGFKKRERYCFFFASTDHACVYNLKEFLELLGHEVLYFEVNRFGELDYDQLIREIKRKEENNTKTILNFTLINNETGVVWPLNLAERIKRETNAIIHVDAVQLVGKVSSWTELSNQLDAYTFSGHKFGSLKSVGFTFLKNSLDLIPLITGGNQQKSLRAGTENALGIYSLKLALEDIVENFNPENLLKAKEFIEDKLKKKIEGKGEVIAASSPHRNLNTIFFLIKDVSAQAISMRFDMAGVSVSTGSACSSGIIKENRILMNMGYSADESKSALRLSFSPLLNLNQATEYWIEIEKILNDIIK